MMVASGGELVIGNFSDQNGTQSYMEVVGEWILQHRSSEQLTALAMHCDIDPGHIRIGEEAEGVNLFLHIRKPEVIAP